MHRHTGLALITALFALLLSAATPHARAQAQPEGHALPFADFPLTLTLADSSEVQRLNRQLAQLAPQRPGQIDLYVLGVAGDASERVFAQEVEYLQMLMDTRFATAGRSIGLYNAISTIGQRRPQASLTNLRHALQAIATRMDVEEDVLLLYLTMHGTEEHELALLQADGTHSVITPTQLREALDTAGIVNRVVVISACFSGGFADALDTPNTLFIAAARHDRTSFGCGTASNVTWFGQAWMVEGLNQANSFGLAFQHAQTAVRERERRHGYRPSHPQLHLGGKAIKQRLNAWQATVPPNAQVLPYPWQTEQAMPPMPAER